ncbi:MAG: hypothetical protein H0X30_12175 [Anaerolineae bacterium]|nr:hypothetical protein [Anaerolineae bacterium]
MPLANPLRPTHLNINQLAKLAAATYIMDFRQNRQYSPTCLADNRRPNGKYGIHFAIEIAEIAAKFAIDPARFSALC